MGTLERIVAEDEKQRYSFNEDKKLIRANQGHSIPVDVELEEVQPLEFLYHGTGEKYVESIDKQGLIPKARLYVHLSADEETARKSGKQTRKAGYLYRKKRGNVSKPREVLLLCERCVVDEKSFSSVLEKDLDLYRDGVSMGCALKCTSSFLYLF